MGFMASFKNIMLGADYEDDEDDNLEEERIEEVSKEKTTKSKQEFVPKNSSKIRDSNILTLPNSTFADHSTPNNNVIIAHPKTITEASTLCSKFKDNHICIIDLEGVEQHDAQRIADILSGAVYVLEGNIERVTNNVFIMAPKTCAVSSELKEQIKSTSNASIFPWLSPAK